MSTVFRKWMGDTRDAEDKLHGVAIQRVQPRCERAIHVKPLRESSLNAIYDAAWRIRASNP